MFLNIAEPEKRSQEWAVGIDFGTTYSLVFLKNKEDALGRPFLPGEGSSPLIPTVLGFKDGDFFWGEEALVSCAPHQYFLSLKRWVPMIHQEDKRQKAPLAPCFRGTSLASFQDEQAQLFWRMYLASFAYFGRANPDPEWVPSFRDILSSILEIFFAKLRESLQTHLGAEVSDCVITVPAHFDEACRFFIKEVAEKAGFYVLRTLAEPTAAALAYGIQTKAQGLYGVYDLGGGTFDFSLLSLENGVFHVQSTSGDLFLGGDDLDKDLLAYILPGTPWEEASNSLRLWVKSLKEHLSLHGEAFYPKNIDSKDARLENYRDNPSFSRDFFESQEYLDIPLGSLTTRELQSISEPLLGKTLALTNQALKEVGRQGELKGIILVGGSTRMPWIKERLEQTFQCPVHQNLDPDLTVVRGAGIHSASLLFGDDYLLLDVTPLSMGVETMGGLVDVIIPKNTALPARGERVYTTGADGQTSMDFHVVQGEREVVKGCLSLGRFILPGLSSKPKGKLKVKVTFFLDPSGILSIEAREEGGKALEKIRVNASENLSYQEIQAALADQQAYEGDDFLEKITVQKTMEARDVLHGCSQLLASVDNPSLCRNTLITAKERVEKALKSHDLPELKAAVTQLNQAMIPWVEANLTEHLQDKYGAP